MTPSVLGSALGVAFGIALCAYTVMAAHKEIVASSRSSLKYPRADWLAFAKGTAPIVLFLAVLQWLPELLSLVGALLNTSVAVNERSYAAILFVGHALAFTGMSAGVLGLLWATWQATRTASLNHNEPTDGDA
jgi:hypothetical protein